MLGHAKGQNCVQMAGEAVLSSVGVNVKMRSLTVSSLFGISLIFSMNLAILEGK